MACYSRSPDLFASQSVLQRASYSSHCHRCLAKKGCELGLACQSLHANSWPCSTQSVTPCSCSFSLECISSSSSWAVSNSHVIIFHHLILFLKRNFTSLVSGCLLAVICITAPSASMRWTTLVMFFVSSIPRWWLPTIGI